MTNSPQVEVQATEERDARQGIRDTDIWFGAIDFNFLHFAVLSSSFNSLVAISILVRSKHPGAKFTFWRYGSHPRLRKARESCIKGIGRGICQRGYHGWWMNFMYRLGYELGINVKFCGSH